MKDLSSHVHAQWIRDIRAWLETQPGVTEGDSSPLDGILRVMNQKDARLAAAEAQHEADAKLLAEHAETVKRYREKYEQEREDRQKAESRQYSVGAEHLREYAARVKERDEARQQSENYRTELFCLSVTNPCGHLGRFMEQGVGCAKCQIADAEARIESLLTQLRNFVPEPGVCEHGVVEGDWCEPCNQAYKEAAKAAGGERWLTNGQYAGHAVR